MLAQSVMLPCAPSTADALAIPALPGRPDLVMGLGVLTCGVTPGLVDEVIEEAGCREKRRRLLPARTVVYFVLGMCLFSGADSAGPPGYRSVMRWLTNGRRHVDDLVLPASSALTRARQRLGSRPLELLFSRRRGPLAAAGTPGAFAFGLRLAAWDGTGLDTAGTPANAAASGVTQGGNPQLRLLSLIECGTHAVIGAVFDGVGRASEQKLARRLLRGLGPGMLLLADRNFPGYELWGMAAATGADLLWRIKKNQVFVVLRALPDGSFLSVMPTPAENSRHGQARAAGRVLPGPPEGHLVRIVEYSITVTRASGGARVEPFRLVTTVLDHERARAARLAETCHQRWEIENGFAGLKTRLRGAAFILRSRSPELVRQELFAFLTVCQSLCSLRAEAAQAAGIDPDRISLTVTVRIARDHAASQTAVAMHSVAQGRRRAIRDVLGDLLPARRDRQRDRVKKPPENTFPSKKRDQARLPEKVTYKITISRRASLPAQTP